MATYGGGELGGLSGLSALLSNWRQGRVQGRNVVCGEAALEGAAGIVGRAKLGAERGAQRGGEAERGKGRVFAGGAQAAAVADAGGEGHGQEATRNTLCSRQRGSLASWACGVGRCEGGGAKGSAARGRQAPGTQRGRAALGDLHARHGDGPTTPPRTRTGTDTQEHGAGALLAGGGAWCEAAAAAAGRGRGRGRSSFVRRGAADGMGWDGSLCEAAEREARCDLCAGGND
jgi:hypothetical protein